jgi:serine/threonine protein kinase
MSGVLADLPSGDDGEIDVPAPKDTDVIFVTAPSHNWPSLPDIRAPMKSMKSKDAFAPGGAEIGKGTYGTVYRITDSSGREIATKMLSPAPGVLRVIDGPAGPRAVRLVPVVALGDLLAECKVLMTSRNKFVVHALGVDFVEDAGAEGKHVTTIQPVLNMPLALSSFNPEKSVWMQFFPQTAFGLSHLHDNRIAHLDIKCDNTLVFLYKNDLGEASVPVAKLTDFGLSQFVVPSELAEENENLIPTSAVAQTYGMTAPEFVATGHHFKDQDLFAADVFSLGLLWLAALTGSRYYPLLAIAEKMYSSTEERDSATEAFRKISPGVGNKEWAEYSSFVVLPWALPFHGDEDDAEKEAAAERRVVDAIVELFVTNPANQTAGGADAGNIRALATYIVKHMLDLDPEYRPTMFDVVQQFQLTGSGAAAAAAPEPGVGELQSFARSCFVANGASVPDCKPAVDSRSYFTCLGSRDASKDVYSDTALSERNWLIRKLRKGRAVPNLVLVYAIDATDRIAAAMSDRDGGAEQDAYPVDVLNRWILLFMVMFLGLSSEDDDRELRELAVAVGAIGMGVEFVKTEAFGPAAVGTSGLTGINAVSVAAADVADDLELMDNTLYRPLLSYFASLARMDEILDEMQKSPLDREMGRSVNAGCQKPLTGNPPERLKWT